MNIGYGSSVPLPCTVDPLPRMKEGQDPWQGCNDEQAKAFWNTNFPGKLMVPVHEFSDKLALHFHGLGWPSEVVHRLVDHFAAGDRSVGGARDIHILQFVYLIKKFGPFEQMMQNASENVLDQYGEIQPWYHGSIHKDPAEIAKTFQEKPNRFLIRKSTSQLPPDDFVIAISRLRPNFVTKQNIIRYKEGQGFYIEGVRAGQLFECGQLRLMIRYDLLFWPKC